MFNISSLSFCGGGSEACGSLANSQNKKNATKNMPQCNITFESTQNARPYVSKQFSNAFDFGAFGFIKNVIR